jgi:uncharacterized membrane protein
LPYFPLSAFHFSLRSLAFLGALVLVVSPLAGWPPVVRLSAVVVPALLLWVAAALLLWCVASRFESGSINAVDFTVYFDRPLYQTAQGRVLFVETADRPSFSQRTELTVHAYWALIPFAVLYWIHPTPYWLFLLSVGAVVAGSVHVLRIGRRLGAGGLLACAGALAFALNDNTARALNYGFHPEILYLWFVPWLIDAALAGALWSFVVASIACLAVKEDAVLPLFAAAVALCLTGVGHVRRGRLPRGRVWMLSAAAVMVALANLWAYYGLVVSRLAPGGVPTYSNFWDAYGATPFAALAGMVRQPLRVVVDTATSGFVPTVLPPFHLFALIGWRWSIGVLPMVGLFGASANEQLRQFDIYYSALLVPFLALGTVAGALGIVRRWTAPRVYVVTSALVLVSAIVAGRGYVLRPWNAVVRSTDDALQRLDGESRVLVQSGLDPHAGYEARVQLLTADSLRDRQNAEAAVLLAARASSYALAADDLAVLHGLREITPMPEGLRAVRLSEIDPRNER